MRDTDGHVPCAVSQPYSFVLVLHSIREFHSKLMTLAIQVFRLERQLVAKM